MKCKPAPNAELGELLTLLQELVPVRGERLTVRVICRCAGMSGKTYTALKGAPYPTFCPTMRCSASI